MHGLALERCVVGVRLRAAADVACRLELRTELVDQVMVLGVDDGGSAHARELPHGREDQRSGSRKSS